MAIGGWKGSGGDGGEGRGPIWEEGTGGGILPGLACG